MKYYKDFADFLAEHFDGKMQKLSVNAGFTCPNRDGTVGTGGCTYCNNQSFSPDYCRPLRSVTEQLAEGKQFFARKYPSMRYLAYFQAYTSTHSADVDRLMDLYHEACSVDGVDGVIIGTRPDCMPDILLERLRELPWVMVEYGAESSHDTTLDRINRCHSWSDTVDAVVRTHRAGIPCGLHLINGLPGENEEMMLATVDAVNALPVDVVKFHQLQLIRGTRMAVDVEQGLYDVPRFTPESYARLCAGIVKRLRSGIAIERFVSQSPPELLIYPRWGLKNYQFTEIVNKEIKRMRSEMDRV
ncbi:TIGR01212 family radical SAM protein [Duncaniella freteri]|uniref:TIGR01212 family radical SAM protein n=1 Tax=Duncaniella freteri TaxID=2530391 RepID=UPI0025746A40|nr:TIGR01212 family radical SAM protein [Duncaniella freteri]